MRGALARAVAASVVALLLAVPAAGRTARADGLPPDPESALRAARASAVPRLAEFAAWCNSKGLPRSRDRAWEAVLRFEPDHAAARRALHYTRGKGGAWERAKPPAAASEPDPAGVPEFAKRRDEAIGRFAELAFAVAEAPVTAPAPPAPADPAGRAPAAPAAPPVSAALHEAAVDDLLTLLPDDERARKASKETLAPGGWRLDETLRARVRRAEIAAAVAAARSALPPQTVAAEEPSAAVWGVTWAAGVQGTKTRVFGGPRTNEAAEACTACDVGAAVHASVLGVVPLEVKGLTVFLFASGADAFAAIDRDPRFSPADRRAVRDLGGWWVGDKPHAMTWVDSGPARVDAALRQTFGLRLRWQCAVDTRRGWAWEGFGLYMSEAVLQSHLTVFAGETSYGAGRNVVPGLADRLRADTADWLAEGRALEASAAWPDFRVTLGRPVEAMAPEEILQGYLLARYLVEGRPEDVPATLAALGKAGGPDAWCASALSATVEGLERRLRRWVRETSAK